MSSNPRAISPDAEFLALTIEQQFALVNGHYYDGHLGYFELPTGLALPEHGWYGGTPWGFRRSPAAEATVVFERSPRSLSPPLSAVRGGGRGGDPFHKVLEDLEREVQLLASSSTGLSQASSPSDSMPDVARGIGHVWFLPIHHTPVISSASSPAAAHQSTNEFILGLPPCVPPRNAVRNRHDSPLQLDFSTVPPAFPTTSFPRPSPVNFDAPAGTFVTDRGIFSPFTGPRPRRSKTHPSANTDYASSVIPCHSTAKTPSTSRTRHRSHSVLNPPRDVNHQVRTYGVTDPITGERINLLDDDDYDPPTSYKLSDITPEDLERAKALGKRRCTRCRRWRPEHRFQHKHNRCIFCQARIDAGMWLVGNQKRKRVEVIAQGDEGDGGDGMDECRSQGPVKRHHPGGGGNGGGGFGGASIAAC